MAKPSKNVSANNTPRKGLGGRKPGAWTLLTPEALRAFRAENKLSRARLAAMLGVSSTSVQNWETGAVASLKVQQRLAELIKAGSPSLPPQPRQADRPVAPREGSQKGSSDTAVSATAAIVGPYAGAQKDLSPQALLELVRSVRQALS